ncbi:hypothetical protein [Clostridium botulinum]|nr:hypothetical protein [Clostridium botulinum]
MRSLLVVNNIDIQYGGNEYLNGSIITRAIKNIKMNLNFEI